MRFSLVLVFAITAAPLFAQPPGMAPGMGTQNWDNFEIAPPEHVAGNIYKVVGGIIVNMAFSVGDDGIILVDSNFAALSEKIIAAIREVSDEPIRFLIDTHAHADHADGNISFAQSGTMIFAHDSVRMRLANPPQGASAPPVALPIVTFADEMTFHVNGEEVQALHVAAAHTDGDVLIFFRGSDVIHMGDVFVGQYPIIDVTRGGSYIGLIETLDTAIALVGPDTTVVPGHGPLSDRDGMIEYRNMLQDIYDRVRALISEGRTLEEVITANPSAAHDERWTGGRNADGIIRAAYREISGQ